MPSVTASAHVAHIDPQNGREQALQDHLLCVASLAGPFADKIGLGLTGWLLGLLHDLGKYSEEFQRYLRDSVAQNALFADQDSDDPLPTATARGSVDHSTAGAQLAWERCRALAPKRPHLAQILALVLCSHHSGLIDCLSVEGRHTFFRRMGKEDLRTHLDECRAKADPVVLAKLDELLQPPLLLELQQRIAAVAESARPAEQVRTQTGHKEQQNAVSFALGLLTRFLLSCLLDADRIDSAMFGDPRHAELRAARYPPDWPLLRSRLEKKLAGFSRSAPVNALRASIADACAARGREAQGFFTLTVPTGGGKTLASLRFALAHVQEHQLDRIIYVIPFTSIIDQNAAVARNILEPGDAPGSVVLEHHSSLQPERETWQGKLLAANWDSPVVFTTMVQLLETLFGSGTSSARRMHSLARSVLIFDEIQTLPLNCVHLFCNALRFLVHTAKSTVLLCTATQPLLGNLPHPARGQLPLTKDNEIVPNVSSLFGDLHRVTFRNHCGSAMNTAAIAALAREEVCLSGSCLVITNTKGWAERVFRTCSVNGGPPVFYLSTHLCPAHRLDILRRVRKRLEHKLPVICVSTQLIECGVDVSFGAVIRFAAGLDSILQAAGRCNRNGERRRGIVHIVTVEDGTEHLDLLPDIAIGRRAFFRLLHEVAPGAPVSDLTLDCPDLVHRYFTYYFHEQADKMVYPLQGDASLLHILGLNSRNPGFTEGTSLLQQSFAYAASQFQSIDAPTRGLIVPYKRGKDIIAELASASGLHRRRELLRKAQRYTVNIYQHTYRRLERSNALLVLRESDVVSLREGWYDNVAGVCVEPTGAMEVQIT